MKANESVRKSNSLSLSTTHYFVIIFQWWRTISSMSEVTCRKAFQLTCQNY